jgi:hypothetical protein
MRKVVVVAIAGLMAGSCSYAPEPGRVTPPPREREDLPLAWAEFQSQRRLPPGMTELDPALLRNAQAQAAKLPRYSTAASRFVGDATQAKAAPRWESLGPDNIAGRTRTLVFDPRNPDRLLAGGVSGGVWESTNAGESWRVLSDEAQNINIGALVIDPVAPDVIYAGTGELYRNSAQPYSAMWGQGILRSRDGGRTFQQLAATANDDFRYVSDIVISRVDHNRLYAATNSGIWRSDDAGGSFTRLLRPTDGDNPRYEGCNDLLALPDTTRDRLLAVCSSRSTADRYWLPGTILPNACGGAPCPSAIFRNDDAAGSGAFVAVLSEPGMGRATLDYARSNPNVVYAAAASIVPGFDRNGDGFGDYQNGLHAVFRSTDGGATWSARLRNSSSDALSTYLFAYANAFEGPRCFGDPFDNYSAGWYNQAIAVDPLDENIVWAAGMEIYRSDDGGATFGKASYWFLARGAPQYVHADSHYLTFDPRYGEGANRRLYVTNDGGIARTEDARAPLNRGENAACGPTAGTVSWRELTSGMTTTQFYTGAVTADGRQYLGGLQDNSTVLNTSDGAQRNFRSLYGGDGAGVAFDPRNPNTFYVSAQGISIGRTTNGGNSFTSATSGLNDATIFIMPYILDPLAPDRLYAGGTRLWRTDDQGRSWRPVSATFGNQFADRASALAVSPVDANRMLVGNQRRIFRSTSALSSGPGTGWTPVTPRDGWVSSLVFDPVAAGTAYATYSTFGGNHVWRTDDSGATWRAIDGTGASRLPDIPVHTLAIDPTNRDRLFVGTDLGVFVTVDGGTSWAVENSGFTNVIVESLQVARDASPTPRLYAFTYGRGAWRVPLSDLDGVPSYAIGADTSGAFYNAQQSGHGWLVESVIADGVPSLIAAWYTYVDGEQRWLYGSGPVTNGRATLAMSIGRDGQFPPNFTGATIEPWGTLVLDFADADHGTATWTTSYAGFGNGSMTFERLAGVAAAGGSGIQACTSGSWFNAQQPGHGLQVQVIGPPEARQLLAVWYAYRDGAQRWFIGNGPITGDTATVPLVSTRGGRFPPNFDPAAVVRDDWGTLTFRAIDANRARIDWDAVQSGYSDGGLDLVRLSSLRGHSCTP